MPKELFHPGANHCVDLVVVADDDVLLIRRGGKAGHGEWALPGGFVNSKTQKGEPFIPSETWTEAAVRELKEETGLIVNVSELTALPTMKSPRRDRSPRDPRETAEAFTVSHPFLIQVDRQKLNTAKAGDDAKEVGISKLYEAAKNLRFADHNEITENAMYELERMQDKPTPLDV